MIDRDDARVEYGTMLKRVRAEADALGSSLIGYSHIHILCRTAPPFLSKSGRRGESEMP